jgi:hypothetical protein
MDGREADDAFLQVDDNERGLGIKRSDGQK